MRPVDFFEELPKAVARTEIADYNGERMYMKDALEECRRMFEVSHAAGGKVVFVGNGGSGAIASHMAIDYTKNGGIRATALNDHPTLTCLANDFGYEQVFAKQIEFYATPVDTVVIISTSGKSKNIIEAARASDRKRCNLVTLSGMEPQNELRYKGNVNFYVPSSDYGIVEISHLTILHAMVDCL